MKTKRTYIFFLLIPVISILFSGSKNDISAYSKRGEPEYKLSIDWTKTIVKSKTSLTIQICPEPPMLRSHPASKNIYKALRDSKVNYARLQPWFAFPRFGVAELEAPKDGKIN